ncbi:S16 family serine protease [Microbacterium sp. NIBRBAC000506063]|uniref:S16 family serine protease n=1 Tax=Microbacterium sp. NIBRBAC000506063 TaxID=2734618 RepID=UPI002948BA55|nr:S16 family serine protease [Microbacterium sp. NIBRBAC000506063]
MTSSSDLRAQIQEHGGERLTFAVARGGEEISVEVVPEQATQAGETSWVIGVYPLTHYEFPIDVTIQLDNVGGPSAGLMFALGIIDQLTPGELTGGEDFAGTGTIDSDGAVGPIGGIRQKLYGARDAGAEFFFAPESNCGEVVGHVPDGLQVIRTATLEEALEALEVIANDGDVEALPSCSTADAY